MPRKNEPTERSCIVSREVRPTEELIRFVLGPGNEVVPDLRHRLPGRGVWVSAQADLVAAAEKKRLFNRGFKTEVIVEPGLSGRIDALLKEAALSAISFARKAGEVVNGFAKVESAIARDAVVGMLQAEEAGEDGRSKVAAALRRRFGSNNAIPVIRIFHSDELDLALGRSNVIHAALLAGRASENVLERVAALARFRGENGLIGIGEDDGAPSAPNVDDGAPSAPRVHDTREQNMTGPATATDSAGQKTTE